MMMQWFRHNEQSKAVRGEEGSALVELALSLPMLCLMLLGAAEFAKIAYASIEVSNAAHAGAVYAASTVGASTDTPGIGNAATADSGNMGGADAVSVTSVTTSCVCSNTAFTPTSCSDNSTCSDNNSAMITTVTVTTQATYSPLIRIPGGALKFTLQGQSSQVVSAQ
ncbi:MAG TPA: TadE family protein [Terracidiphilus sp.]|jgi:Flp pilus assembly protein TadG